MKLRRLVRASLFVNLVVVLCVGLGSPAWGATAADIDGKEWRQLTETTGMTWSQVAAICPRDGQTPCSGSIGTRSLTGWVWATDQQVIELMAPYAPELLTANPPSVSGSTYMVAAINFLSEVMRPTFSFAGYPAFSESTAGWTASTNEAGAPLEGRVGFGFPPAGGGFSVAPSLVDGANSPSSWRGIWLWRPSGDHAPPVVTPNISGTAGTNGWYVSDVSLTWSVVDAESPIDSTTGCDPASVTADTAGASFTCEATSGGGTSQATATVKRDATRPAVTCDSPAPAIPLGTLGAKLTATVTDATSGPVTTTATTFVHGLSLGSFSAPVTGTDRAGNKTTVNCSYQVVVPPCLNLTPTIVGTAGNDTINGTSGPDVIQALGGLDTINGNGGDDVICGYDGPDNIYGGSGKDNVDGGVSNDNLNGGDGDDNLNGGANSDSIRGDGGKDTCISGEVRNSSCEVVLP